ncbi:PPE domain-containing protein [Amycolatopsis jejuensis]|uniref:PPE domain-containing protein n=1 Tax=Amycolatopsis jejuensis TaxID=330084 RepID=UPI000526A468|nr:collagen-like protein [Amycolatopsis jejuensis]
MAVTENHASVSDPKSPDYDPRSPYYEVTADPSSKYYIGPVKSDDVRSGDEIRDEATREIDEEIRKGWLGPVVDPKLRDRKIQERYEKHLHDAKGDLGDGLELRKPGTAPHTEWRNASHELMLRAISTGADSKTVAESSEEWVRIGNDLAGHQKNLAAAINASTANWRGGGGDAAREHLANVGKWLGSTAQGATLSGRQQEIHSQALHETQKAMVANPPVKFSVQDANAQLQTIRDPVVYALAAGAAMKTFRDQQAARDQAAQIMTRFDQTVGGAVATPQFVAPPKLPGGETEAHRDPAQLIRGGPDGHPGALGPDGKPLPMGPDGKPLPMGPDGKPLPMGPDGKPLPMGPDGKPLPMGPDGKPLAMGPDGKPMGPGGIGPDGMPLGGNPGGIGPDGKPLGSSHTTVPPKFEMPGGPGGSSIPGGSGNFTPPPLHLPDTPGGSTIPGGFHPGNTDSTKVQGFTPPPLNLPDTRGGGPVFPGGGPGVPGGPAGGGPGGGPGFTPPSFTPPPFTPNSGPGGSKIPSTGTTPFSGKIPSTSGPTGGRIPSTGSPLGGKIPSIGESPLGKIPPLSGKIPDSTTGGPLGGSGGKVPGIGRTGGVNGESISSRLGGGGSGFGGRAVGPASPGAVTGAIGNPGEEPLSRGPGAGGKGAPGSPGMGGMGAGGGRGGTGPEDKEHKIADYVESDDPSFFAPDEVVAPPVIGDWKNQDWK